jgi:hypothetical protein
VGLRAKDVDELTLDIAPVLQSCHKRGSREPRRTRIAPTTADYQGAPAARFAASQYFFG